MKQTIRTTIACCAALLSFAACENTDDLSGGGQGSGAILINLSPGEMTRGEMTRAEAGMFDFEKRVDHLDVLIFEDTDDPKTNVKKWHERILTGGSTTGEGTVTLKAGRKDFEANRKYRVYVIANASDEEKALFEDRGFTKSQLLDMQRTNNYIHLTGMPNNNSSGITLPQTFLMDGAAYAGATEPTTSEGAPMATAVVLNDGVAQNDTQLKVTLRRAAAKLVLKLIPGTDETGKSIIKFLDPGTDSGAASETQNITGGYYLRNMPYTTSLLAESPLASEDVLARTPRQTRNHYFDLHSTGPDPDDPTKRYIDYITVTAYAYARSWAEGSTLTREPRWIVDIPLEYNTGTGDRETVTYTASYYQIPVCKGQKIERNTCYTVQATISAPGGTDPSVPVNLTNLAYEVEPWIPWDIKIGGEDDRPKFLTVNRTEMEMRNIATDNTTLQFTSSSEVTATVTSAYYIDKFGQTQQVSSSIRSQIKLTPDDGVSGNIAIESPVPTNKTIRYIEIEVKNTDKDVEPRKVLIKQYPLEYITNIQSWYSYRDDFHNNEATPPTTYEYAGDRIVGISHDYERYYDYTDREYKYKSTYTYNTSSNGFWRSKVAETQNSDGSSHIKYYYYSKNYSGSTTLQTSSAERNGNARMYHVRIEATSKEYTIGRPRLNEQGYTDKGPDNAKLVSPSFMIASRLGFLNTGSYNIDLSDERFALDVVREHCARYVEVYRVKKTGADGKETYEKHVLDDWRLPTNEELRIIMKFQGTQNQDADAIDYLLNASHYWSASERVENTKSSTSGTSVRCIRDAYDDPATGKETDPAAGNQ